MLTIKELMYITFRDKYRGVKIDFQTWNTACEIILSKYKTEPSDKLNTALIDLCFNTPSKKEIDYLESKLKQLGVKTLSDIFPETKND